MVQICMNLHKTLKDSKINSATNPLIYIANNTELFQSPGMNWKITLGKAELINDKHQETDRTTNIECNWEHITLYSKPQTKMEAEVGHYSRISISICELCSAYQEKQSNWTISRICSILKHIKYEQIESKWKHNHYTSNIFWCMPLLW